MIGVLLVQLNPTLNTMQFINKALWKKPYSFILLGQKIFFFQNSKLSLDYSCLNHYWHLEQV